MYTYVIELINDEHWYNNMGTSFIICIDHQNFFGVDESIGPVAISLRRERIPDDIATFYGASLTAPKYQHRVIVRTSEVSTCIIIYIHVVIMVTMRSKPTLLLSKSI